MKIERDERRFDFHDIGLAIKRAREASGMTQEQLAYIVDRAPQTRWTSGQIVPKSRRYAPVVCGMSLLLLGLIFPPVRHAEQMINVRLDCHSLPHIRLGLAVIRRGLCFNFFCTFFLGRLLRSRFAYDIIHPKTRRDGAFLPKGRFMLWSIWAFL